jgi:hypothetical protein
METEDFSPQARQGYGSFRQSNPQSDNPNNCDLRDTLPFGKDIPHSFFVLQLPATQGLN